MNDTVYRKNVINTMEKIMADHPIDGYEDECLLINAMKSLPSAQRWIPCSKRLPEEKDYKSCMECLDGAVWYFTEKGAMGLGYYYESTKQWATTNDLKTDGKVIAWQPLPDPWKGDTLE